MLLQPLDADDPETVADFEAGRDYYGPSPRPWMPCMDPPGMPGKIEEMRRRAEVGAAIFAPGADAGEDDRIGFLGSRWGYAEDEFTRRAPVVETATGPKRLKPAKPSRPPRPHELSRTDAYRRRDAERKRVERAKRKAEREEAKAEREAGARGKVHKRRYALPLLDSADYSN